MVNAASPLPATFPHPRTRLVGRSTEVAAARAFLLAEAVPLLTLTGPGGVGKTRLALAIAHDLAHDFGDGVRFVSLAPVRDPAHVPFAISRALDIHDIGGQDPLRQLATVLNGHELLLVIDNLEHVLPASPWIADFLQACPTATVLATSRERLRIVGEQELHVAPFAVPESSAQPAFALLRENPAIRLFTDRTRARDPAFALTPENAPAVAEICRQLDGLPLAIELVAAHARVLPPVALLARLEPRLPLLTAGPRDAPARQRTMRDTITWSHDLLSADERLLFRRIAVFAGGFTLDAAEAVTDRASDALQLVASLVDRSLLIRLDDRANEPRFRTLETIREFAWEQLAASGEEEEIRRRHAAWCLAVAERFNLNNSPGSAVRLALDRLEAERDNLRAGLTWLLERGEFEMALRLGINLHYLWTNRGPASEGRAWLARALTAPGSEQASPAVRGLAMQTASVLAWMEGAFEDAANLAAAAVALAREAGAEVDCIWAINLQGMAPTSLGNYEEAAAYLDAALALSHTLGALGSFPIILTNRAVVSAPEEARAYLEEALAHCRETGSHPIGLSIVLNELGRLACLAGNVDEARQCFGESLRLCWSGFQLWSLPKALEGLACVAVSTAQPAAAVHLLAAASALRERTGAPVMVADRRYYDQIVQRSRQQLSPAGFAAAWDQGRAQPLEHVVAKALNLAERSGNRAVSHTAGTWQDGGNGERVGNTFGLSPREREVLAFLCQRLTDAEIGEALCISTRTASRHVANIFNKLGVSSRRAAAALAIQHDLV